MLQGLCPQHFDRFSGGPFPVRHGPVLGKGEQVKPADLVRGGSPAVKEMILTQIRPQGEQVKPVGWTPKAPPVREATLSFRKGALITLGPLAGSAEKVPREQEMTISATERT